MNKPKIVTVFEYPPIPQRIFDWRAYREGDEERTWRHGWGRTEEEALADLQRIDQEMEEDDPMMPTNAGHSQTIATAPPPAGRRTNHDHLQH